MGEDPKTLPLPFNLKSIKGEFNMPTDFYKANIKTSSDVGILDPAYIFEGIITDDIAFGETVAVGNVVYLDGTANEWLLADADAAGEKPAWGIVVEASGSDGTKGKVMLLGMITVDGASYTEGGLVYLSATAGSFTQSAPGTPNDQILGVALSTTKIWINPHSILA
jgi:hypothetical protein